MAGDVYAEIEDLLSQELVLAQQGDAGGAVALGRRISALMAEARRNGATLDAERAVRLRRLYDALDLTLAQQLAEVKEKRAGLSAGRRTLRAYAGGSSGT